MTKAGGLFLRMDGNFFQRLLDAGFDRLVLWIAILAVAVAVAAYVIDKVRAAPAQRERPTNEMLTKFRESHLRGELSDEEFRTIKAKLATQLQEELNDNGETG